MESHNKYLDELINGFMETQKPYIKTEKMRKRLRNIQRKRKATEIFKSIIAYTITIAFILLIASADSIAEMI